MHFAGSASRPNVLLRWVACWFVIAAACDGGTVGEDGGTTVPDTGSPPGVDAEVDAGPDGGGALPCVAGPEETPAACADGCSNDEDRFIDCDDFDCDGVGACPTVRCAVEGPENTPEACSDGCSNDDNRFVDCADFACAGVGACGGEPCRAGPEDTVEACSDGCSNDGDPWADCDDFDCADIGSCMVTCATTGPENTPSACSDGCSNDGDIFIDCDDADCNSTTVCGGCGTESAENTPSACSDGCSNDGDRWADCDDFDCTGIGACPARSCTSGAENTLAACDDACSNDGDALIDCLDPDCVGLDVCPGACAGATAAEDNATACSDDCSNDDDTLVDCDDPDCAGVGGCPPAISCAAGPENTPAACSDGCSNDGDPSADCSDSDCDGIGGCAPTVCVPDCGGRECGGDGCVGSCGSGCASGERCNGAGVCVSFCTPGETRCIAGTPGGMEICSALGTWTFSSCAPYQLCTDSMCRPACGLSSTPAMPFLCVVPNRDRVNDGVLLLASDALLLPPYTAAGVRRNSDSDARVRTAPTERHPYWPYEWEIPSSTISDNVGGIAFRLDHLRDRLGDPPYAVRFTAALRRRAAIYVPGVVTVNYYTEGVFWAAAPGAGAFFRDERQISSPNYYDGAIEEIFVPAAIGPNRFDYTNDCSSTPHCNELNFQIRGTPIEPPMDVWVNWMLLTIE
jgi:hypothetical protein